MVTVVPVGETREAAVEVEEAMGVGRVLVTLADVGETGAAAVKTVKTEGGDIFSGCIKRITENVAKYALALDEAGNPHSSKIHPESVNTDTLFTMYLRLVCASW